MAPLSDHLNRDDGSLSTSSSIPRGMGHGTVGISNSIKQRGQKGSFRRNSLPPLSPRVSHRGVKPTAAQRLATYMVDNQIKLSLFILHAIGSVYLLFPAQRETIQKFWTLSYKNESTGLYMKGMDDWWLVGFWIVVFTLLRATCMDYVFVPYARHGGVKTRKGLVRFAEQAWLLCYYTVFWTLGMYIMYKSPYWMSLKNMWTAEPQRELDGLFKWYYLVQFAFWLQQIFVLNIEERRKDHYQMFAHHIITCALMLGSYTCHVTRVGNVILCIMDIVDILLPAAKMLKYLGYRIICDVMFGIFMVVWFVGRHIIYLYVIKSVVVDLTATLPYECFRWTDSATKIDSDYWSGTDEICWTKKAHYTFIAMLVFLQFITIIWFFMICRVAAKVLKGGEAEDTRSDDEDNGVADEDDVRISNLADRDRALLEKLGKEGLKNVRSGCSGVISNGNLNGAVG